MFPELQKYAFTVHVTFVDCFGGIKNYAIKFKTSFFLYAL